MSKHPAQHAITFVVHDCASNAHRLNRNWETLYTTLYLYVMNDHLQWQGCFQFMNTRRENNKSSTQMLPMQKVSLNEG